MPRRIAVAAVGIPTAFGLVWAGGWALVGLMALLGAVGTHEFYRLANRREARPLRWPGVTVAAVTPAVTFLAVEGRFGTPAVVAVVVGWVLTVMLVAVVRYTPDEPAMSTVAVTVFAPVYAGALPSALLWLRHGSGLDRIGSTWLVFFPLAMVWICDTFAMTGGSMMGGPKFAPTVSPNKTWSGTIAGLVGAVMVALIFQSVVFPRVSLTLGLGPALAVGVAVGVLGQVGDLAESMFKRSAGVKDSGGFFPGHGGVLDRLDSLYWALPVTALLLAGFGIL